MRSAFALLALALLACTGCAIGVTGAPSGVTHEQATVEGSVISDAGGEVEYWAKYGRTTAYGSETAHETVEGQKNTLTAVNILLEGLERDTAYHYRLCAQDSTQQGGPGCGEDRRVRTQSFACGETIAEDVRLTGNLLCLNPAKPALAIGANGLDINLAGFSMRSIVNTGGGIAAGIENLDGFDDVTIRNGEIGNFGDAIHLDGATRNKILHMRAFGPSDGIDIRGGGANEVRDSVAFGRGAGLVAVNSDRLVFADSTANGAFGSAVIVNADLSRILRNEVVGGAEPCCVNFGIAVTGNGNLIRENRVGGWNAGNIAVRSGSNNVLIENEAFDGVLSAHEDQPDSRGDGIFVGAFTAGTVLRGNFAHDNASDGIDVLGSAGFEDNTANDNGVWGIDAPAGATDLGGNSASGNGNALQCRNVFCQ